MARPARFTDDDILDGAARALAESGRSFTVAAAARAAGAPTGSIYHRFASREELAGRLWLRSIERFHVGLREAYAIGDPHRAVREAAAHVPRFCEEHPTDALAMTLFHQEVLVADGPETLREQAAHVNDEVDAALEALVGRRYGDATQERRELLMVATRLSPYGLVRPFVGRADLPGWVRPAAVTAADAIAALGD